MKKVVLLLSIIVPLVLLTFKSVSKLASTPESSKVPPDLSSSYEAQTVESKINGQGKEIPKNYRFTLPKQYFQTFNNCGPATLSMTLAYYQIDQSQQVIGDKLRPYQNPQGNNDIKSVSMDKLAKYAEELNLEAVHLVNGDIEIIKFLVSNNIPVITRTLLTADSDIGHYRIIIGYDDLNKEIIQSDSYQGADLHYSYDEFFRMWEPYGYEYLVVYPADKEPQVKEALGNNWDESVAWQSLLVRLQQEEDFNNAISPYPLFNQAIAYYHLGNYEAAKTAYESVATKLPWRTLWYQLEPILTYQKPEEFDRVSTITNQILNNGNRAYPELYFIQAQIYEAQKNLPAARERLNQALFYDPYYADARNFLNNLGQ